MRTVLLVSVAWMALAVGTASAEDLCLPPAFSMRINQFAPREVEPLPIDLYWDVGAQKERVDIPWTSDAGPALRRVFFDFAAQKQYEYAEEPGRAPSCQVFSLSGSLSPYCLSKNAQRVRVETLAGQRAERWCELDYESPRGTCFLIVYTVQEAGFRIPRILRSFVDVGVMYVETYTNLTIAKHGLPPSTFELPPACAGGQ
jgi:hypothetical protein